MASRAEMPCGPAVPPPCSSHADKYRGRAAHETTSSPGAAGRAPAQATASDQLHRRARTGEAIRLGRILSELMPDEAEAWGLLAPMLQHVSRRETPVGPRGELVVLEEQNRSRRDRAQIAEGTRLVEFTLRMQRYGRDGRRDRLGADRNALRGASEHDALANRRTQSCRRGGDGRTLRGRA